MVAGLGHSLEYCFRAEANALRKAKLYGCILSVLAAALIVGCSTSTSPEFVEGRDKHIAQGKGGAVRRISGVEFWESGEPDRKYQVLGVIRDDTGWIWTTQESLRRREARLVQDHGGNGAIVLKEREKASQTRNGTIYYRWITKFVFIRYAE